MADKSHLSRQDPYLKSGVWKCSKSPTGAHYWIIRGEMMRCKYCGEERQVQSENKKKTKIYLKGLTRHGQ
ncbi:hypothetical protein ES708_24098 [subsurface metagenome]